MNFAISVAPYAMHRHQGDTVGPHGLDPALLVFSTLPRLPTLSKKDFRAQKERLRAIFRARNEYEEMASAEIVKRGTSSG